MRIGLFLATAILALLVTAPTARAGELSRQAADFFFCIGMNAGLHAATGAGKPELAERVEAAMAGPCESAYDAYEREWARYAMRQGGWSSLKSSVYRDFRDYLQETLADRLAKRFGS